LNKGCSASVARFADNSIMLDKNAVGASIPTIFCDEDDVIGEHAASFAAIDKEKLYYLMSRGFDELSAKKLIIDAAFRPVFNSIPDELDIVNLGSSMALADFDYKALCKVNKTGIDFEF